MADLVPRQPDAVADPVYDPTCTPCVLTLPHDHPQGQPPLWPCLHCHNAKHRHCHPAAQFCTCSCGL